MTILYPKNLVLFKENRFIFQDSVSSGGTDNVINTNDIQLLPAKRNPMKLHSFEKIFELAPNVRNELNTIFSNSTNDSVDETAQTEKLIKTLKEILVIRHLIHDVFGQDDAQKYLERANRILNTSTPAPEPDIKLLLQCLSDSITVENIDSFKRKYQSEKPEEKKLQQYKNHIEDEIKKKVNSIKGEINAVFSRDTSVSAIDYLKNLHTIIQPINPPFLHLDNFELLIRLFNENPSHEDIIDFYRIFPNRNDLESLKRAIESALTPTIIFIQTAITTAFKDPPAPDIVTYLYLADSLLDNDFENKSELKLLIRFLASYVNPADVIRFTQSCFVSDTENQLKILKNNIQRGINLKANDIKAQITGVFTTLPDGVDLPTYLTSAVAIAGLPLTLQPRIRILSECMQGDVPPQAIIDFRSNFPTQQTIETARDALNDFLSNKRNTIRKQIESVFESSNGLSYTDYINEYNAILNPDLNARPLPEPELALLAQLISNGTNNPVDIQKYVRAFPDIADLQNFRVGTGSIDTQIDARITAYNGIVTSIFPWLQQVSRNNFRTAEQIRDFVAQNNKLEEEERKINARGRTDWTSALPHLLLLLPIAQAGGKSSTMFPRRATGDYSMSSSIIKTLFGNTPGRNRVEAEQSAVLQAIAALNPLNNITDPGTQIDYDVIFNSLTAIDDYLHDDGNILERRLAAMQTTSAHALSHNLDADVRQGATSGSPAAPPSTVENQFEAVVRQIVNINQDDFKRSVFPVFSKLDDMTRAYQNNSEIEDPNNPGQMIRARELFKDSYAFDKYLVEKIHPARNALWAQIGQQCRPDGTPIEQEDAAKDFYERLRTERQAKQRDITQTVKEILRLTAYNDVDEFLKKSAEKMSAHLRDQDIIPHILKLKTYFEDDHTLFSVSKNAVRVMLKINSPGSSRNAILRSASRDYKFFRKAETTFFQHPEEDNTVSKAQGFFGKIKRRLSFTAMKTSKYYGVFCTAVDGISRFMDTRIGGACRSVRSWAKDFWNPDNTNNNENQTNKRAWYHPFSVIKGLIATPLYPLAFAGDYTMRYGNYFGKKDSKTNKKLMDFGKGIIASWNPDEAENVRDLRGVFDTLRSPFYVGNKIATWYRYYIYHCFQDWDPEGSVKRRLYTPLDARSARRILRTAPPPLRPTPPAPRPTLPPAPQPPTTTS